VRSALSRWLLPALLVVFVINWFWAADESSRIGGTALGGYVRDGHYFLQSHNVFTEVDRSTWEWSLAHTVVTLLSWPIAVVFILVLSSLGGWRWILGATPLSNASARQIAIEASGPAYLSTAPAFQVSDSTFSPGATMFVFHPDGVVISPPGVGSRAIARRDVIAIEDLPPGAAPAVLIRHSAPELGSPITIFVQPSSDVAAAIRSSLGSSTPPESKAPTGG
jgi:hypothetical protein